MTQKKMAKEITWKYLDDVQHAYEIMFNKDTDVDYLMFLMKQQLKKINLQLIKKSHKPTNYSKTYDNV